MKQLNDKHKQFNKLIFGNSALNSEEERMNELAAKQGKKASALKGLFKAK